jgi:hypothetical protein
MEWEKGVISGIMAGIVILVIGSAFMIIYSNKYRERPARYIGRARSRIGFKIMPQDRGTRR